MLYSTVVDKNENGLLSIIDAAQKFEENGFMEAISNCGFSKEKILTFTEYVKELKAKLKREHLALAEFSEKFNKEYATDNNECFESAKKLFYKIRSTISGSKKIYKRFCMTVRKRQPSIEAPHPSVFKFSELVTNYRNKQLFGMTSYDECVANLYDELGDFFVELIKCLALCRMILMEEREIRSNPERCMPIYKQSYDNMVSDTKDMIRFLKGQKVTIPADEMEERRKNAGSLNEHICKNYHVLDKSQWKTHVWVKELEKGQTNGLDETEVKLYGAGSIEQVQKVRLVIAHFDELEEDYYKGKHKNKHYAPYVAALMLWSGIGKKQDGKVKLFVEEYFNKKYTGAYPAIRANAVNTAKNNIVLARSEFDYEGFCTKIELLIDQYTQNEASDLKMAVNF